MEIADIIGPCALLSAIIVGPAVVYLIIECVIRRR